MSQGISLEIWALKLSNSTTRIVIWYKNVHLGIYLHVIRPMYNLFHNFAMGNNFRTQEGVNFIYLYHTSSIWLNMRSLQFLRHVVDKDERQRIISDCFKWSITSESQQLCVIYDPSLSDCRTFITFFLIENMPFIFVILCMRFVHVMHYLYFMNMLHCPIRIMLDHILFEL